MKEGYITISVDIHVPDDLVEKVLKEMFRIKPEPKLK
jgi:hypothetical protein